MYIKTDELDTNKLNQQYLASLSLLHGRTFASDMKTELDAMYSELPGGEEPVFKGTHLDTCANRSSIMSINQYRAYCKEFRVPCKIDKSNQTKLRGIGGSGSPIGTATIPVPFHDLNLTIDVNFKIVPDNVSSLLSNRDMIENCLDIRLQEKVVTFGNKSKPLLFSNCFFIHRRNPSDVDYSMYTESEYRQLHRSFGHPFVTALINVLKRANPEKMTKEVKQHINDLMKRCGICAENLSKPKRFKLTVGSSHPRFNRIVAADIMFIENRAILHVVDETPHFSTASFLQSQKSKDVWK